MEEIAPIELSHGGNLIVHLYPHPVIARIAVVHSSENTDRARSILARELSVARHLHDRDVPVLMPTGRMNAGPHDLGDAWMTAWTYAPFVQLQPLKPSEAVARVNQLSLAMSGFKGELPRLGVWERACRSAARLANHSDPRVRALLRAFAEADRRMRSDMELAPSHGDAHAGNLLPSPEGWLWSDFEDASLMPVHWDLASFVGNRALFGGFREPLFRYIVSQLQAGTDREAFGFTLAARTLMSTLGNLDFALAGNGDLPFATSQLERAELFLVQCQAL